MGVGISTLCVRIIRKYQVQCLARLSFTYIKIPALFNGHPLKKIKCLQNWLPVFKRTYKIFVNEKSFQQYLILAIFLCLLLELSGQGGRTLLKFK